MGVCKGCVCEGPNDIGAVMEQSCGASFKRTQLCSTEQGSHWEVTLGHDPMCLVTWMYVKGLIQQLMDETGKAAPGTFLYLSNLDAAKMILKAERR